MGLGVMGVEGLVMAGEGEGMVGTGVVVDFSVTLVVLDVGETLCVFVEMELDVVSIVEVCEDVGLKFVLREG